jgi:hypothetical protein
MSKYIFAILLVEFDILLILLTVEIIEHTVARFETTDFTCGKP